jgi:hypothetical protein
MRFAESCRLFVAQALGQVREALAEARERASVEETVNLLGGRERQGARGQ